MERVQAAVEMDEYIGHLLGERLYLNDARLKPPVSLGWVKCTSVKQDGTAIDGH